MRIIVTGASGFIGSFLMEALALRGDTIQGWNRPGLDITDAGRVAEALSQFTPDVVIHLAAQSLPGRSWEAPGETYRVNVGGTINLLEAACKQPVTPRVLLAGSSAEYAEPNDGRAIAEDARLDPNSPYGGSKLAVTQFGKLYARHYGLDIVSFRPFALVGPRKTGDACSDFARRIVAIERGAPPTMRVGDLNVVRDMIDVRDGVAAIVRLVDAGVSGEIYNICAGGSVRIADVLETLRRLATVPVEIDHDPALLRPLEQKVKIGDPSKLRALGWAPARPLDETLADILAYWRTLER